IADYQLSFQTSEYVGAVKGAAPNRITDELGNGLCPVYPSTNVGEPLFTLVGKDGTRTESENATAFNAKLGELGLANCQWGASSSEAEFTGATLVGLTFDERTGHFFQEFQFNPTDALSE